MSRTHKKNPWAYHHHNKARHRQIAREKLRVSHKYRDRSSQKEYKSDHKYRNTICSLFSKGKLFECIFKCLTDKHGYNKLEAHLLIDSTFDSDFHVKIHDLVCIKNNHIVSSSTPNLDPCFLIYVDLPIYFWNGSDGYCSWNLWDGGKIVYSNNKILKFNPPKTRDKHGSSIFSDEDKSAIERYELKVWPNQKITKMVGEAVNMFLDSGMHEDHFEISGWQNVRYQITSI